VRRVVAAVRAARAGIATARRDRMRCAENAGRQARSQGRRADDDRAEGRISMLQPARRKFRKEQKGRNTGVATRGANVSFGDFGLKALERGRLTARQIEAARRAISRHVKRGGRIWIRIFPDKPISQKPAEVRMGNGKGNPEYYVAEITPGKVLYEINGVPEALAREAFLLASAKLPLRCRFVARQVGQ
jgi:large subunit ribosomal protein L16